jgi:hypothetical protein
MSKLFLAQENILLLDDDLLMAMAAAVAEAEEIIAPKKPKFGGGPGTIIIPRVSRMPRRVPARSAVARGIAAIRLSVHEVGRPTVADTMSVSFGPALHPRARQTIAWPLVSSALAKAGAYAVDATAIAWATAQRMHAVLSLLPIVGRTVAGARAQVIDPNEEELFELDLL